MTDATHPRSMFALRWLPVIVLAVAALIHLSTFDAPLLERHSFRQTQTAYTARIYHEEGIDLLHPKLPVLGPPWEVPFEFPLFQAAAALVMDLGVPEDTSLRVTGFATFALSAALLWTLLRRQAGRAAALLALSIFALSPLAMEWSRAATIEYLALGLSLAFAVAGLRWRDGQSRAWYVVALLCGCIAALVKITTAAFWIAPFALLGSRRDDSPTTRGSRLAAWGLSILPLLVGLAWARHADTIKAASAATSVLTSSALLAWNVGDLPLRLDPIAWARVVAGLFLAGGIVIPVAIATLIRHATVASQRRFWAWIGLTIVGPVLLFFNLYYQHDYYSIAISASVAATAGAGLVALHAKTEWRTRHRVPIAVAALVAGWLIFIPYWAQIYGPVADPDGVLPLAAQIERETPVAQPVAIIGRDWSPAVLYYAHRRGWMVLGTEWPAGFPENLIVAGYAVYRCPWQAEGDHCDRLNPGLGVPVRLPTIGPVTAGNGLLASSP